MASVSNQFHLSSIYQGDDGYNYSVPQKILETWYRGEGFGESVHYTKADQADINQDLSDLLELILCQEPIANKQAVYTAGAPGAGKSTLLNYELRKLNTEHTNYAFNDPDEHCLQNMQSTYWKTIDTAKQALKLEGKLNPQTEKEVMQHAYTKWRAASNYIAHAIQGVLISRSLNFAFGTTATSPLTFKAFEHLHEKGYHITVLHLTTEDEQRIASALEHSFFHTTEEDIREKAKMLPDRLKDTFLSHVDIVKFYRRATIEDAVHAATFMRAEKRLEIFNEPAYKAIANWHDTHKNEGVATWGDSMSSFVEETRIIEN